jgi:hypothetical protein
MQKTDDEQQSNADVISKFDHASNLAVFGE